jgi:hypothetical protein
MQGPGSLGVVSQIIVTTTGPGTGVFIYNGTPGLGNAPIFSISNSALDFYSNVITPSLTLVTLPVLIYTGPPAHGNLYASISSFNGTDSFGNNFDSGYQIYGSSGSNIEITVLGGLPRAFFSTGAPEESATGATGANISAQIGNPGASQVLQFIIAGPEIGFSGTSMSVTATASGAHESPGITLEVQVWTGQAAVPLGASLGSAAVNPPEDNITPTVIGSMIFGCINSQTGAATGPFTPNGNTTFGNNFYDSNPKAIYSSFHSTSKTTALVATSYGATLPAINCHIAMAELLPGTGLTLDASTPAIPTPVPFSSGLFTISTAAFTPPAGSILVAMVSSNYDGAGLPITMTVAGGGLTWTKVADDADAISTVWFAVVPDTTASQVYAYLSGEALDKSVQAIGQLFYADAVNGIHQSLAWGINGVQVMSMLPGDSNSYQTERLTVVPSADVLINVVAPGIQITNSIFLGVGQYYFDCQIRGIPNVNGGAMQLEFGGNTSVATITVECIELIEGTPGTLGNIGAINNFAVVFQGATYVGGKTRTVQMRGTINCTASGLFAIFASTSIAADTWTFKQLGSFMNMYPVGS